MVAERDYPRTSERIERLIVDSGTDRTCGGGRDRNVSSYRIRIRHVRVNTRSTGRGGTG